VLLHGIGGSRGTGTGWTRSRAAPRATAPDLLGFGRSPRRDQARYDVEEHLEHLEPLIAPGSVVVAHGTGAVLAAALAVRRPDLIKPLLLIGAPLYADVPEARREVRRLGFLAGATASGEVLGQLTMIVLHTLVPPVSTRLPLDLPREVVEDFLEAQLAVVLADAAARRRRAPDLERLTMPCTLLCGADDQSAFREPLAHLSRHNARLTHVACPAPATSRRVGRSASRTFSDTYWGRAQRARKGRGRLAHGPVRRATSSVSIAVRSPTCRSTCSARCTWRSAAPERSSSVS
jgi:pimeloyl-ACP methyl ester carboxylesterase